MARIIPVFFLPVDREQAAIVHTVAGAEGVIAHASQETPASGLREATSTNGWHGVLAVELCRGFEIRGLDFLESDLRVLTPAEAESVSVAVAHLKRKLKSEPLPSMDREMGPELEAIRSAPLADLIDAVSSSDSVHEERGDAYSFVQFLATLDAVARDASGTGRHMLFYAPRA